MNSSFSFIIITNGNNTEKLSLLINSIINQKIEDYEIILCGEEKKSFTDKLKEKFQNFIYVEDVESARGGFLGKMRNSACILASKKYLVISDDDMLFHPYWYKNFNKYFFEFDILTTCVKCPDGTRFWDKCCYKSPENGHKILNYNEEDDYLYMSGGQSWIMKRNVFEDFKWNETLSIYNMKSLRDYNEDKQNEDTEFAQRCRSKYKISHNNKILSFHNDESYTSFGRLVRRRYSKNSFKWCESINFEPQIMIKMANDFLNMGLQAECLDLLRCCEMKNPKQKEFINIYKDQLIQLFGNELENSVFSFDNKDYILSIKIKDYINE